MSDVSLALDPAAQSLLFRQARTPNSFAATPVRDEQLEAIYDLVKWAPTSTNQQPMRITLVRSAEARASLLEHVWPSNRGKVSSAPVVALLTADLNFHERLPELFPHAPNCKDLYADPDARRESAVFNAALQVAYFIIGVRAAGLAAGPILGYDPDGINKTFFGDGGQVVVTVLNIGVPGENPWFPRLPRLTFGDVVSSV
ncbi:putative malonic semialdehyde reductase RutE [Actinomadura rubteroloni]|uniref:Putative malonic semialdehyde reductase RutE n=1 Tax=Actinomadura rubteroloni TaxID=1926885 RepID=A0A2P4UCT1_9ACTN|nr:malonic semialdehyde reductase [Actinomadura rubteroloni]POM22832.1 putative malonic semialdehyde reductase RutE [Actinomadura rubteroloni]